jgi:hypothetical protein
VGAKSEGAEWKLKVKLPPFSAFLFFYVGFFSLFCLRRKRCQEKVFEIER